MRAKGRIAVFLLVLVVSLGSIDAEAQYTAFPSDIVTDGKFLALAGNNALGGARKQAIYFWVGVDAQMSFFELSVFDGNQGGLWDLIVGQPNVSRWRLYADPDKQGIIQGLPVDSWTSDDMAENAWSTRTILSGENARSQSGNYFYLLIVDWPENEDDADDVNSFKIRTNAQLSLVPGDDRFVAVIGAPINTEEDDGPGEDPALGTAQNTNDGIWRFYMSVPENTTAVALTEKDADHRLRNGYPADDNTDDRFRIAPDIRYELYDPDGILVFTNLQPSGNQETRTEIYSEGGLILKSGLYEWRWSGQDAHNQTLIGVTFEIFSGPEPPIPVQGITLVPDHTDTAAPGSVVSYSHTVTNKESFPSVINLEAISSRGWTATFYDATGSIVLSDTNLDGRPDVGTVLGGQSISFMIKINVPVDATSGTMDTTRIRATTNNTNASAEVIDTTTVQGDSQLTLTKSVDKTTAAPNEQLTYTISYRNIGSGLAQDVVVIDTIPEHTTYVRGSAFGNSTTIAYQHVPGGPFDSSDAGTVVAIKWTLQGFLNPQETGTVGMKVTID